MKVFVTGASGFVGREVLRQLREAGHDVRILARHRGQFANQGVEIHIGDVINAATLAGGLEGIDAVIHLVGIISEIGSNTFENVHTRGTENMVAAAQKAGVRRFVHMSALGTRPNAVARYHQSKWAAEEIVRSSGLDWTIFRPSIIYGTADHFVNLFARMSRFSPVLPVLGDGSSLLQPVPIEDVAKCFVQSLSEPQTVRQAYDLCGPERLNFEKVLDAILAVTGRRRLKLHLPMGLARFQATALEFVFPKLLGKAAPLNRDQLLMLSEDNVGDAGPANEVFRLEPVRFAEGITRYLKRQPPT